MKIIYIVSSLERTGPINFLFNLIIKLHESNEITILTNGIGKVVDESYSETIEEVAERFYPISKGGSMWIPSTHDCNQANKQEGFIKGAEWQAKKMFNKEDIRKAFKQGHSSARKGSYNQITEQEDFDIWFEQFKKK
jgi:hypothetical protein